MKKHHLTTNTLWHNMSRKITGLCLIVLCLCGQSMPQSSRGWTLDEALGQLHLYPQDAFLQYVVLQLARRENRLEEVIGSVERVAFGNERLAGVDLFSIFTGALAVQESLQLDTMRGEPRPLPPPPAVTPAETSPPPAPPKRGQKSRRKPRTKPAKPATSAPAQPDPEQIERERIAALEKRRKEIVPISGLTGPTVKSHPWEEMLGGKKPEISPMARYVPDDFYFAEFRSLTKLLDAIEVSDVWGTHLLNQSIREARTSNVGDRVKRQLALETQPLLRPFYDLVVEDVAVTGSDPFLREGSDVTLLFKVRQPAVFKARMDGLLTSAKASRPDAVLNAGKYLGVEYVHLTTPDREINAFVADPVPGLHVRSNSKPALQRVIESIQGKKPSLADMKEFAYIRALMPRGAPEEDGFVYLSDPFIRRLVGPELKLTERRRMLCYNHLRMIGHASLLYRAEHDNGPSSLAELADTKCAPGLFGQGELVCPDGGSYALSADMTTGVCSRHGHAQNLTPNLEIPVTQVTGEEADQYNAFLEQYNQYWRIFFDPIALRMKMTPQQYRLETIILPLIDNSIYAGLASAFGGAPEPLDGLPVPKRNIFSVGVRLDKQPWLSNVDEIQREFKEDFLRGLGVPDAGPLNFAEFVSQGIGNQIGFHVYDAYPTFDLNLASFLGEIMGSAVGRSRGFGFDESLFGLAIASLNMPVYLSIPVQDARIVDTFMDQLDTLLAFVARERIGSGLFRVDQDFFEFPLSQGLNARGYGLSIGPIKLRFFWSRIGNGLHIATKPFILEDILALQNSGSAGVNDADSVGHAMVRVRAQNWNQVLPDYKLSWAENDREACLSNLGLLTSIGRAWPTEDARRAGDKLHGAHFFCPENGDYTRSPDGRFVICSVHGNAIAPKQPTTPGEQSAASRAMRDLTNVTTTLHFTGDGLRAVVNIERK